MQQRKKCRYRQRHYLFRLSRFGLNLNLLSLYALASDSHTMRLFWQSYRSYYVT